MPWRHWRGASSQHTHGLSPGSTWGRVLWARSQAPDHSGDVQGQGQPPQEEARSASTLSTEDISLSLQLSF